MKFLWIYIVLPVTLGFNVTCPDMLQRVIRSKYFCKESSKEHYSCLFDELKQSYVESCVDPDFVSHGQKYIVSGLRRNAHCSSERYQPFKFWSNMSSQCIFAKSTCNEIGQILVDNVSTSKDTLCRCDYTKGLGFIKKPRNPCFCIPSEEDCTCYAVPCPLNHTLTADYQCKPETVIARITFCSKIQVSRKDNEITDLPVSKTMWQITSKPWDRKDIRVVICLIVLTLAYVAGLSLKGYITMQRTTKERARTRDQAGNTANQHQNSENQPQNRENLPENTDKEAYVQQLKIEMQDFEKMLIEWIENATTVTRTLEDLSSELDVHFSRISKTKIGGSAAGIVGGVLGIVGLALTPVTFGASLGLSIAGGVVAGIGGATVGGSLIADNVLSKRTKRRADTELGRYSAATKSVKRKCLELNKKLSYFGPLEEQFKDWVSFWKYFVHGQESKPEECDWIETIELITTNVESAARFVGEGFGAGIRIAGSAVRVTGTALHVASGIIGVLMIPLDVYTLVDSAIDVHKKNKHETSQLIINISNRMKKDLPKKENIETMIEFTLKNMRA